VVLALPQGVDVVGLGSKTGHDVVRMNRVHGYLAMQIKDGSRRITAQSGQEADSGRP
jgi:hypothetical protein